MRWKDPVPAQVASMDKISVLRLLGLLTGGTLLRRGSEVEMGVSRWAWSLLARLPERGELTSEEIGVVRELGKKAVLVGMGIRRNKNWEEGMREVEKDFDEDEHGELPEGVHGNQIELESEDEHVVLEGTDGDGEHLAMDSLDEDTFIGPKLMGIGETSPTMQLDKNGGGASTRASLHESGQICHDMNHTSEEEGEIASEESPEDSDVLAAARARILARLGQDQTNDSDSEGENMEIREAKDKGVAAIWNTKATVDMIITVAGEMYGQRDLLEFRGAWEE